MGFSDIFIHTKAQANFFFFFFFFFWGGGGGKNFEFQYFWGIQKSEYFRGMKILWIFSWVITELNYI